MFHLWRVCICCATDLDASTLACLRRLLFDEEVGVLAVDDGSGDGDDGSGYGDEYLCNSELRGILDKQKNNH